MKEVAAVNYCNKISFGYTIFEMKASYKILYLIG